MFHKVLFTRILHRALQHVKFQEKPLNSIPLRCGGQQIGQMGKRPNVHLGELFLEVTKASPNSYHPNVVHARTCHYCIPNHKSPTVLGSHMEMYGREIIEAFMIKNATNNVLEPSWSLSTKQLEFLSLELSQEKCPYKFSSSVLGIQSSYFRLIRLVLLNFLIVVQFKPSYLYMYFFSNIVFQYFRFPSIFVTKVVFVMRWASYKCFAAR